MIQSSYFTFAIILMAFITFIVRYAFFTSSFEIKLNQNMKTVLSFTAPCILTALFIPFMFKDLIETKQILELINSSYFLASLGAIVFSLTIKNTLMVIILSLLLFYVLRHLGL